MSGGGRVNAIKPWDLASGTLVYGASHFRALLILFAIPEIIRIGMYFVYGVAVRNTGFASWVSDRTIDLLDYGVSALILTGVVRYIVLAEGPSWLPSARLRLNYLTTAVVMAILANVIDLITGSWLSVSFYQTFLMETPYDDRRFLAWSAIYSITGFFLSIILIAGVYPLLGVTAVHARFDLPRLLRWNQRYFGRFLVLALLMASVCLLWQRVYWWLFNTILPGTIEAIHAAYDKGRVFIAQLIHVPVDIVFDLVPAIAVGLLFRALSAKSADL